MFSPSECEIGAHKKESIIYITLSEDDTQGFVIQVVATCISKTPRVFSRLALLLFSIPKMYCDSAKTALLASLAFPPRVWKVLFEAHQGRE